MITASSCSVWPVVMSIPTEYSVGEWPSQALGSWQKKGRRKVAVCIFLVPCSHTFQAPGTIPHLVPITKHLPFYFEHPHSRVSGRCSRHQSSGQVGCCSVELIQRAVPAQNHFMSDLNFRPWHEGRVKARNMTSICQDRGNAT